MDFCWFFATIIIIRDCDYDHINDDEDVPHMNYFLKTSRILNTGNQATLIEHWHWTNGIEEYPMESQNQETFEWTYSFASLFTGDIFPEEVRPEGIYFRPKVYNIYIIAQYIKMIYDDIYHVHCLILDTSM